MKTILLIIVFLAFCALFFRFNYNANRSDSIDDDKSEL